jgi:predicted Zn-dependent protease
MALLSAMDTNFAEAIKQLQVVRAKYPRQYILNVDLGTLYMESGQLDKALPVLREAYRHDPTDMYAVFRLAQAVEKKGDLNEAEKLYHEVAKVTPEYSRLYYELGRLKAAQGETGVSNFYLAKYYLYEGRMKFAKQYLKRAAKDKTVAKSMQDEAQSILDRLKELDEET